MTDYVALLEANRFLGREFLLWLWFESEIYETELKTSAGPTCSIWIETQLTLASDTDEARIRSVAPGTTPEAKQALRQGKLPTQANLHAIVDENEFTWVFKADAFAVGALKVPSELKATSEPDEALYERMMLLDKLQQVTAALFDDFIRLRLTKSWGADIFPLLKAWSKGEDVNEAMYQSIKSKTLKKARR